MDGIKILSGSKISDGETNIEFNREQKELKFLKYIASELSEDPLIIDDDMINWIRSSSADTISILEEQYNKFKELKAHRVADFLFMINWKLFFVNIYSEILIISVTVYTSFGSSSRWDDSPLILPIIMLSAGAASYQRTVITVFNGVLPENSPRMRAHKRLLLKLFPA